MQNIVFFSLIIISLLRIIGVGISIDFYSRTKDAKFITFSISWALWFFSSLLPLIRLIVIYPVLADFLLIFNVLFTTISIMLLVKVLLIYFVEIKNKYLYLTIFIIIVLSHLLYFTIGIEIAVGITSVISQAIWITCILFPFIKWNLFIERVNKQLWYLYFVIAIVSLLYIPISAYTFIEGLGFGLYDADNIYLVIFNYGYLFIITFLIQILMIHLEYTLSQMQKFNLKDKYSHNLGNALQAINTSSDLLSSFQLSKKEEEQLKVTLSDKLQEAAKLLEEIRKL